MHTTSTQPVSEARSAVFAACWSDARYVRLHERKASIGAAMNYANSNDRPEAERLENVFLTLVRRIAAFEDRALRAAGLNP